MGEIVFVGLGLHDENGISLRGLEEIKTADKVFVELYTSLLPDFSLKSLKQKTGKDIQKVSRKELEEENGKLVLEAAKKGKTVLLVPGDPLIATTHVSLRLEAQKRHVKTRLVHGASILSAVIGLSGLHNYKFGKSVTIPFPDENPLDTPYETITQNVKLSLHTLCLLDIQVEKKRYLDIHDALEALLKIEVKKKCRSVSSNTLAIGIARAGSKNPIVKAAPIEKLLEYDFGGPPQSVVFPGKLHFMEAEALVRFCGAPKELARADP